VDNPSLPSARVDAWNPDQYAKFRDERARPFFDLLAMVEPKQGMRAVDLGCGPGELTAVLADRLPESDVLGLDNSPAMIAKARDFQRRGLRFEQGDIAAFADPSGEGYDLIFSNAALHWVRVDHASLLARLAAMLRPGGQLAIQVPANANHPTHRAVAVAAMEEPFRAALRGVDPAPRVLEPEAYADLLWRLGLEERRVRLEVYSHELESRGAAIEWIKGSLLTAYEALLPAPLFAKFVERVRSLFFAEAPDERPYHYAFRRTFFAARKR